MTSDPNYLGQGDHFPHLLASQISSSDQSSTRPRSTSVTKIKIRIRPLTIRFTEAGVNDLNIQVKARIDSKHDIPQQDVSKRDSKGKGKARAVESDVPPQDQDQDDDDELSQLLDDLDDSVRALKAKIRRSIPQTKDRNLRLIHSGRILSDGTRLVSWLDSLDSHRRNQEFKAENGQMGVAAREFVGLVGDGLVGIRKGLEDLTKEEQEEEEEGYLKDQDKLSKAKGKGKARAIEDQDDPFESRKNQKKFKIIKDLEENTTYIQCSIGDLIEAKPAGQDKLEEDEEMKTRNGMIDPAPRGFDRLLTAANLTHEEIEEMRARFRASRGIVSSGDALFEDEEAEHTRALEEQWIESLSPQENTSTSNNDTYSTMLEGVLVGFFLPFLPLFFLSDRSSPSSIASPNWNTRNSGNGRDERIAGHHLNNRSSYVFSEEMKQAIVFGLVSNLIFGAFRMMW